MIRPLLGAEEFGDFEIRLILSLSLSRTGPGDVSTCKLPVCCLKLDLKTIHKRITRNYNSYFSSACSTNIIRGFCLLYQHNREILRRTIYKHISQLSFCNTVVPSRHREQQIYPAILAHIVRQQTRKMFHVKPTLFSMGGQISQNPLFTFLILRFVLFLNQLNLFPRPLTLFLRPLILFPRPLILFLRPSN